MVEAAATTIKELWVYPVKACQGVKVTESKVTPTGLEFDRTWCIVDLEGTHVPKNEAISGRRIPVLASIQVSFNGDKLCLDAPGMSQCHVPTYRDAYENCATVGVVCAGPLAGGTWELATLNCKQHAEGSAWISEYLNTPKDSKDPTGTLINGKKIPGKFALVRSLQEVVDLGAYPPILPLIERAKTNPEYKARFEGNYRRLSDFAPFLLVSQSSARDIASKGNISEYPVTSFRGNIIVDGDRLQPWDEETWATLNISSTSGAHEPLRLHTIKQCPRCTAPCRDQTTGQFLYKDDKFKLWKVLKAVSPLKFIDPEWGSWAGVFMGVYMGHNGVEGNIMVGDVITPTKIVPWDAHLQPEFERKVLMMVGVGVAIASVGAARFFSD